MKISTLIGNAGTPLSCATEMGATARRGTGMAWATGRPMVLPTERSSRLRHGYVDISVPSAEAKSPAFTTVAVPTNDGPMIKQFRVPLSRRERSP